MVGKIFRISFDYYDHPLVTPLRISEFVAGLRQTVDAKIVLTMEADKDDANRPLSCLVWIDSEPSVANLVRASFEQRFVTKLTEVDNDAR